MMNPFSNMEFEKTWRWFGPTDPISLNEIKQVGATGIVTALHHIPVGDIWTVDEILKRKQIIEAAGFTWSVVESLPVHNDIKTKKRNYQQLIENYKSSLRNIGQCGIDIICYNFIPVLDWSRTNLSVPFRDGSITTQFEMNAFAAFDLFVLKRPNAEKTYSDGENKSAKIYFDRLDSRAIDNLTRVILLGFPGSGETYTVKELQKALDDYHDISEEQYRDNLYSFLREIVPTAEASQVLLAIHPDDPPFPLLGLPRAVSSKNDLESIVTSINSISNGITFCTGSLGAGYSNDCVALAQQFADRTNFIHLRNVKRTIGGNFIEDYHLEGDVDMYGVMKALLHEKKNRIEQGRKDVRMPFRPDHGHLMLGDQNSRTYYPGYSLYGRMRGLAEMSGLELGIIRELNQ